MRCPTVSLALLLTVVACSGESTPATTGEGTTAVQDELAAYRPTAQQEAEAIATLQALFDALETGDEELLRSEIGRAHV